MKNPLQREHLKQAHWQNKAGKPDQWAVNQNKAGGQVNVQVNALAANIFAAATNWTNIHNNTGDMHQCLKPERTTDIMHK